MPSFVQLMEALLRGYLEAGQPDRVLSEAPRLLAVEPLCEPGVCLLMEGCLALGDRSGAMRAYGQLRRRLREELGLDPGAKTQALAARARQG